MACLETVPVRAKQVCDECIRVCHETGDGYGLLIAHTMAAWHFILKGELAEAWVHARESHTLTLPIRCESLVSYLARTANNDEDIRGRIR